MSVDCQLDNNEMEVAETALLSQSALAEDWLKPEEDEAWAYLVAFRVEKPHTNFDHK
jgi:hypothetical protein